MTTAAELDSAVKNLILEALGKDYIAFYDGTETGNHYQSVELGDFRTSGFREDRGPILDKIDFEGKKVLDLGSNLGELSRATRARGARLVDGFEFDPYFVEVANLINVFTETTRVSFFERDISDPITYAEPYDIVLAFAVFGQGVASCLSTIAEITDVLVFETHKLEANFDNVYVRSVSKYFPHYRVIGQSEWGSVDKREVRAVVVFAKDEEKLSAVLRSGTGVSPKNATAGPAERRDGRSGPRTRELYVDAEHTVLPLTFFSHYSFDSPEDLLAAVDTTEIDLMSLIRSHDGQRTDYLGWVYWFLFLKGYLQYSKSGEVGPGNVYYDYVRLPQFDPNIASFLKEPAKAVEYVTRQFLDMDKCRNRESDEQAAESIQPIHLVLAERPLSGVVPICERGRPEPLPARMVDGWHRLFAARVFGVPALRGIAIDESGTGPMLGAIEWIIPYQGGLEIHGWCLDPQHPLARLAVSTDRNVLSTAEAFFAERADVRDAFEFVPHALKSGFSVRCDCEPEQVEDGVLELTALGDWFRPLGRIKTRYGTSTAEGHPGLPEQLLRRLYGNANSLALTARSLASLHDLLEPIGRYRSLDSFESVLDFGCRAGLLEPSVRRVLPQAELTAVEFDPEAVEWLRVAALAHGAFLAVPPLPPTELQSSSYDLVLGWSVLPRLDRDAQAAWLEELHRVMKSEGYAALTVLGELVLPVLAEPETVADLEAAGISDRRLRDGGDWSTPLPAATYQSRSYTIDLCERWFDTIAYVEGGVANQQDLIVVRKA